MQQLSTVRRIDAQPLQPGEESSTTLERDTDWSVAFLSDEL